MNLKGIKITKKMYKKLDEIGISKLKVSTLHGLNEFKKFTWSNFSKQEFSNLIKCLMFLEKKEIFGNLDNKQLFIFNYYTDVTEMDIATVLKDKNENNVIIDIEFKSGIEANEKLEIQMIKRIQDHMQQLFLNEKYVLIGMNDDGFYKASYYDSKENHDILSIVDLKLLFETLNGNEYVETILTQANDLAGINNLYCKMESGEFKYYEETKRATEFILNRISEGKKAVVCLSNPGTGKTVVAFKIFFENENTMFLIMNEKFYYSLGLTKYFKSGRCFFGSNTFLSQDLSDKLVIIDEAQRLPKETIVKIINASKATIIFGDVGQSFMPDDLELDEHKLLSYLRENDIYVHSKELKRSKRYNDSVEKSLKFLTSRLNTLKEKITLDDYEINIFYDVSDFLDAYHNCKGGKKMFTTFDNSSKQSLLIGDENFNIADREFSSFAISAGNENTIGHTLHAISFDVENNFVFLNNTCIISKKKKDIIHKCSNNETDEIKITKFLNELNILFTRGKKALNIYTTDFETYLYLNKKLKYIIQNK